jgi:hypothetical protein
MNEVVIPLKLSGIAALKAELKDLKNQMADAADPEAFAALADKAGDVTKKINSVNSAVNEFKKGSNFDQAKASFDAMGESIMKLDFTKAAKQSANLKQTLGSLSSVDLTKQFTGLISTVKNLGGAFLRLGAQLLVNPIFLMVAIVVAVVLAFTIWEDKLGKFGIVLKVAFAGIYLMVEAIKLLIQGFKDMTDWLGLTSFAAEENAEKTLAANEKVRESSKKREAQVVGDLGREIAQLKAAGEDTDKLEKEVSNTKIREANKRKKTHLKDLEAVKKLNSKYNKDQLEEIKKQIDAENEIIKQANSDKIVARNAANKKEKDDAKAKADADNKEAESKAKAARDKRLAADKASEDQIAAARKIVTDSTKTAQQIELDDLAAAYKKKIDEAVKHKNDTTALVEAQKVQEAAINKKYTDAANAKTAEDNKKRIAAEDAQFLEMQRLTLSDVEFKKLQATQAAEAKMDIFTKDAEMVKLLEKELAAELVKIQDDANKQKTANLKAEADKQKAIDDAALQAKKSIIALEIDAAKGLVNLLGGLGEKNKKVQKAALIANAALSIAEIINNTNVGSAKEVATKGVIGLGTSALLYTKMAISIASVVAATAKGLSALGGGSVTPPSNTGGGGGGGGGDTSTTAVAPVSGPNLFGQANTGSQVNAGGGSNQNITVTAIVSETEITASQQHINNIQQNSVL